MKEIKNIDQLFKAAKEEIPRRSFEQVIERFEKSITQNIPFDSSQSLFSKFFNLNSFLMISSAITILAATFWMLSPSNVPIVEHSIPQIPIESSSNSNESASSNLSIKIPETLNKKPSKESSKAPNKVEEEYTVTTFDKTEDITSSNDYTIETVESPIQDMTDTPLENEKEQLVINEPMKKDATSSTTKKEDTSYTTQNTSISLNKTNISIKNKKENFLKKEQVFLITYLDNQQKLAEFVEALQGYGIQTDLSIRKKLNNRINKLIVQLNHQQGLDWQIKLHRFEQLEIRISLDNQQQPNGIAYRLNKEGKFAKYMTLRHKARSFYKFAGDGTKTKHHHTQTLVRH